MNLLGKVALWSIEGQLPTSANKKTMWLLEKLGIDFISVEYDRLLSGLSPDTSMDDMNDLQILFIPQFGFNNKKYLDTVKNKFIVQNKLDYTALNINLAYFAAKRMQEATNNLLEA